MGKEAVSRVDCGQHCHRLGFKNWKWCRELWLVRDCCGVVCAVVTWMLVAFAEFVVMYVMLLPSVDANYRYVNMLIFNLLAFLALASHTRAMVSDPGAIPKNNATKENIERLNLCQGQIIYRCPKCSSIKPERAHHCSVCKRCIRKMDHHCPWINNCVGEFNQKYFILFTLYIMLISVHAMYLSIMHFVHCIGAGDWRKRDMSCSGLSAPASTVMLIFLIVESLLFGLFTAVMCGTQLSAVCSDETGIESLKGEAPRWERKTTCLALRATFGDSFGLGWFNPFTSNTHMGKEQPYMYLV